MVLDQRSASSWNSCMCCQLVQPLQNDPFPHCAASRHFCDGLCPHNDLTIQCFVMYTKTALINLIYKTCKKISGRCRVHLHCALFRIFVVYNFFPLTLLLLKIRYSLVLLMGIQLLIQETAGTIDVTCDRFRENQAFGQKFCFTDYAGFRSA